MSQDNLGLPGYAYGWHQLGTNAMGSVSVMTNTMWLVKQSGTPTNRPAWKINPLIGDQQHPCNHMSLKTNLVMVPSW